VEKYFSYGAPDLEENTLVSFKVLRNYFHEFIAIGTTILYPLYVVSPAIDRELNTFMNLS